MDHVTRKRYQRLGLVGLPLLAMLLLFYSCGADSGSGAEGGLPLPGRPPFRIQGDTTKAMLPGARAARIDLEIRNPSGAPLVATRLAVTVRRITAPRATTRLPCTRRDFALQQAPRTLDVTIAAKSTSTLSQLDVPRRKWPRIGMLDRDMNQDGCQQSTLTLAYTAAGRLRR